MRFQRRSCSARPAESTYKTYETPKPFGGTGKIRVAAIQDDHDTTTETAAVPVAVSNDGTAIMAEGGLESALAALGEGEHPSDIAIPGNTLGSRW